MRTAFFFGLPGDVDALAPIVEEAQRSGLAQPLLMRHESLPAKAPRAMAILERLGLPLLVAREAEGAAHWLAAFDRPEALFTACETTLRPHRAAHALSLAAGAAGVATLAVQHGFENVGISYFDAVQGADVRFAAHTVLTWLRPEVLPADAPAANRAKFVAIGRPRFDTDRSQREEAWPGPARVDVAVFENLHWHRFDDAYRRAVLDGVEALCAARPDLTVLVRPHPEGRWLTQRFAGAKPVAPNLHIADPNDPAWRVLTADAVLECAQAVLTTPSTIALDAAERGLPVGVFGYGLPLPLYAPLPIVDSLADVARLLAAPRPAAQAVAAAFVARTIASGDAARRALEEAHLAVRSPRRAAS